MVGKSSSIRQHFILRVGWYVNAKDSFVKDSINRSKIDFLQLHGEESEVYCNQFNLPYIKSISMKDNINLIEYSNKYNSASALLLDTFSRELKGGTGEVFDWEKIPKNFSVPLIVAGGLNPDNVDTLLKITNPFCVDVSGGGESKKGIKDREKMKKFMVGVHNATL